MLNTLIHPRQSTFRYSPVEILKNTISRAQIIKQRYRICTSDLQAILISVTTTRTCKFLFILLRCISCLSGIGLLKVHIRDGHGGPGETTAPPSVPFSSFRATYLLPSYLPPSPSPSSLLPPSLSFSLPSSPSLQLLSLPPSLPRGH